MARQYKNLEEVNIAYNELQNQINQMNNVISELTDLGVNESVLEEMKISSGLLYRDLMDLYSLRNEMEEREHRANTDSYPDEETEEDRTMGDMADELEKEVFADENDKTYYDRVFELSIEQNKKLTQAKMKLNNKAYDIINDRTLIRSLKEMHSKHLAIAETNARGRVTKIEQKLNLLKLNMERREIMGKKPTFRQEKNYRVLEEKLKTNQEKLAIKMGKVQVNIEKYEDKAREYNLRLAVIRNEIIYDKRLQCYIDQGINKRATELLYGKVAFRKDGQHIDTSHRPRISNIGERRREYVSQIEKKRDQDKEIKGLEDKKVSERTSKRIAEDETKKTLEKVAEKTPEINSDNVADKEPKDSTKMNESRLKEMKEHKLEMVFRSPTFSQTYKDITSDMYKHAKETSSSTKSISEPVILMSHVIDRYTPVGSKSRDEIDSLFKSFDSAQIPLPERNKVVKDMLISEATSDKELILAKAIKMNIENSNMREAMTFTKDIVVATQGKIVEDLSPAYVKCIDNQINIERTLDRALTQKVSRDNDKTKTQENTQTKEKRPEPSSKKEVKKKENQPSRKTPSKTQEKDDVEQLFDSLYTKDGKLDFDSAKNSYANNILAKLDRELVEGGCVTFGNGKDNMFISKEQGELVIEKIQGDTYKSVSREDAIDFINHNKNSVKEAMSVAFSSDDKTRDDRNEKNEEKSEDREIGDD